MGVKTTPQLILISTNLTGGNLEANRGLKAWKYSVLGPTPDLPDQKLHLNMILRACAGA